MQTSFKSINPVISRSVKTEALNLTVLLGAKLIVDVELAGDIPGRQCPEPSVMLFEGEEHLH